MAGHIPSVLCDLRYVPMIKLLYTSVSFNHTATTEIYTLSLHDALPIYTHAHTERMISFCLLAFFLLLLFYFVVYGHSLSRDRKSTRLNSSPGYISYAVFCLKKKNPNSRRKTADIMKKRNNRE